MIHSRIFSLKLCIILLTEKYGQKSRKFHTSLESLIQPKTLMIEKHNLAT